MWPKTTLSRRHEWGTVSDTLIPHVCVSAVWSIVSLCGSNHEESDTGKNSSQVGASGRGFAGHLGYACCLEGGAGECAIAKEKEIGVKMFVAYVPKEGEQV